MGIRANLGLVAEDVAFRFCWRLRAEELCVMAECEP